MSARTAPSIKSQERLAPQGRTFSHSEAARIFSQAVSLSHARQIVVDLSRAEEATTSAFAQMVLLRRSLLRSGRDLCLANLRDRAAGLFEVNRLKDVLPTV